MHRRISLSLAVCVFCVFAALTGTADATTVSVFYDGSYVDTGGGSHNEAYTVWKSLEALGHSVSTFSGTAASDWQAAAACSDVILVPELEMGDLAGALAAATRSAIASNVSAGDGVIVMGEYSWNASRDVALLNSVFGWSLGSSSRSVTSSSITGDAAGTVFAGGPSPLPWHSGIVGIPTSSLPSGALSLYESGSYTTVMGTAYGSGHVAYLGWDWYYGAPAGSQDGGWLDVLDRAVTYTGAAPIPEPSAL